MMITKSGLIVSIPACFKVHRTTNKLVNIVPWGSQVKPDRSAWWELTKLTQQECGKNIKQKESYMYLSGALADIKVHYTINFPSDNHSVKDNNLCPFQTTS